MDAGRPIVLTPAARTSPTLWSHMRLCSLRAALSINPDADSWVLHSPRAWLGTAFHRLMAGAPADSGEAEGLWDGVIAEILADASRHRLDARFANPERWPGYYLIRQRAIASAVEKGGRRSGVRPRSSPGGSPQAGGSERLLTARSGRLAGRPDQFNSTAVTEYKSSLPDPVRVEAASIVDGYWRQLRLYSVLIGEMGKWPATARIVAASGQVLEEPVNRLACEAEADAAISGLDAMNHALSTGCDSTALASPGQVACGQCPYLAICPAFWSWCEANPWPELLEPAARGTLLSVDLVRGEREPDRPLRCRQRPVAGTKKVGAWRPYGLRERKPAQGRVREPPARRAAASGYLDLRLRRGGYPGAPMRERVVPNGPRKLGRIASRGLRPPLTRSETMGSV